jgi:prephenate dehydrogenase
MPDTTQGLAIVGPGLIGTSIALAAKRRWPDLLVRTVDKGDSLDAIGISLVVVLSAPVNAILEAIPRLPEVIQPQALVIDTGSTKREIMAAASEAQLRHFVGGHPMAGGTSAADARADLFDGRAWFLTNPESPDAVRRASRFVEALGATAVVLHDRGEEHDRLMAAVSHLPQLTATMLMAIVARAVGADNHSTGRQPGRGVAKRACQQPPRVAPAPQILRVRARRLRRSPRRSAGRSNAVRRS